ncbi:MAG: hypothetical protein AB2L24_09485 [Mangrovibacterium sp.]
MHRPIRLPSLIRNLFPLAGRAGGGRVCPLVRLTSLMHPAAREAPSFRFAPFRAALAISRPLPGYGRPSLPSKSKKESQS